jgi:carbon storage regulator
VASIITQAFKEDSAMLVLSRKCNEEIVIAGNIRVKILEITGNRVRLGVEAPGQVTILRDEIQRKAERPVNRSQYLVAGACE